LGLWYQPRSEPREEGFGRLGIDMSRVVTGWWIMGHFGENDQVAVWISERELASAVEIDVGTPLDTDLLPDSGIEIPEFIHIEPKGAARGLSGTRSARVAPELQPNAIPAENRELRGLFRPQRPDFEAKRTAVESHAARHIGNV